MDLRDLKGSGAVGDIALRYLRRVKSLSDGINDHVIGLSLDQIRAIPRVIGALGGSDYGCNGY